MNKGRAISKRNGQRGRPRSVQGLQDDAIITLNPVPESSDQFLRRKLQVQEMLAQIILLGGKGN